MSNHRGGWKPINRREELPAPGTLESDVLDFKKEPSDDSFEIAKDIAAFANASGGTLLVGVAGGSRMVAWAPMKEPVARATIQLYEQSVRDRCAPQPVIATDLIPIDDGFIIAINVWPFPGQPVGVELKQTETSCEKTAKKIHNDFWFPRRTTTHTKGLLPEQLPMFFDAKARRMMIAVESAQGHQVVFISARREREKDHWVEQAIVDHVDPLTGTITATVGKEGDTHGIDIPIDAVQMVSKTESTTIIYISGVVEVMADWSPDAPPALRRLKAFFSPFG